MTGALRTTITVPEISERLGICEETVYEMLKAREIPNIRHGRRYIVSRAAFERWEQTIGEGPVVYSGFEDAERVEVPDTGDRLPKEIAGFTRAGVYDEEHEHTSFIQGGGHGGSHPHLVHEFLTAVAKKRDPFPNAKQSANWTCVGLCAHESALKGGAIVKLPAFTV